MTPARAFLVVGHADKALRKEVHGALRSSWK